MATRSNIGKLEADGTVRSIYAHWDGYPSNNGKILLDHYSTEDAINALLDEGDVSSLGESIGSKHDFNGSPKGECNFYRRDRGETDVDARIDATQADYLKSADNAYTYLWTPDGWLYRGSRDEFSPLTQEVCAGN